MLSTQTKKSQQGFTLIELSIVLVIIGLIVGGVLVGQDLIKAAQVRATVAQFEKYNSAVNTFRSKYNGIPGDLQQTQATAFGLTALTGTNPGFGDGNGLLENGVAPNSNTPVGEILLFWNHLSAANLVDGSFSQTLTLATGALATAATNPATAIPPAKIGRGLGFMVGSAYGYNYFYLQPVTAVTTAVYTMGATGLSPIEASNIDTKMDDGMPNTGQVIALAVAAPVAAATTNQATKVGGTVATFAAAPGTPGDCTVGTGISTDTYSVNVSFGGNQPACGLSARMN